MGVGWRRAARRSPSMSTSGTSRSSHLGRPQARRPSSVYQLRKFAGDDRGWTDGWDNDTIAFAGTRTAPHDLVVGDDDGLVVIPRAEAEPRLAAALARVAAEEAWEQELASGRSTLDVFKVPPAG